MANIQIYSKNYPDGRSIANAIISEVYHAQSKWKRSIDKTQFEVIHVIFDIGTFMLNVDVTCGSSNPLVDIHIGDNIQEMKRTIDRYSHMDLNWSNNYYTHYVSGVYLTDVHEIIKNIKDRFIPSDPSVELSSTEVKENIISYLLRNKDANKEMSFSLVNVEKNMSLVITTSRLKHNYLESEIRKSVRNRSSLGISFTIRVKNEKTYISLPSYLESNFRKHQYKTHHLHILFNLIDEIYSGVKDVATSPFPSTDVVRRNTYFRNTTSAIGDLLFDGGRYDGAMSVMSTTPSQKTVDSILNSTVENIEIKEPIKIPTIEEIEINRKHELDFAIEDKLFEVEEWYKEYKYYPVVIRGYAWCPKTFDEDMEVRKVMYANMEEVPYPYQDILQKVYPDRSISGMEYISGRINRTVEQREETYNTLVSVVKGVEYKESLSTIVFPTHKDFMLLIENDMLLLESTDKFLVTTPIPEISLLSDIDNMSFVARMNTFLFGWLGYGKKKENSGSLLEDI